MNSSRAGSDLPKPRRDRVVDYEPTSSNWPPFLINKPYSAKADKQGLLEGNLISDNSALANQLKEKRKFIQEELEKVNISKEDFEIGMTYFVNWGETQENLLLHAKPTNPKLIEEVVKIITNNQMKKDGTPGLLDGVKIGAGGSYHSWSPMFPDAGGLLINVCDLELVGPVPASTIATDRKDKKNETPCRIILYETDEKLDDGSNQKAVIISPGVTTGELMAFFLKHDVCLESDVVLSTVTYGGVLSGGCHGTGRDQQSMSDLIISLKLVNGKGELCTLPEDSPSNIDQHDVLLASQVNLGVLGIVIQFSLKVQKMSNCRVQNLFNFQLKDICPKMSLNPEKGLKDLLEKHWSIEIFWFPFNSLLDWMLGNMPQSTEDQVINVNSYPKDDEGTGATVDDLNVHMHPDDIKDDIDRKNALDKGITSDNFLAWLWSPYNDKIWVRAIDIYRKKEVEITQAPGIPLWAKILDVGAHFIGNQLLPPVFQHLQGLTPIAVNIGFEAAKLQYGALMGDEVVRTPWAVHYRDAIDLMPVYNIEFAFSLDINNPIRAVKAIQEVIRITRNWARHGRYPDNSGEGKKVYFPLTLCMEMRVMRKSDCFLCPASIVSDNEQYIAYIELLSTVGTPGYEKYFAEVAEAWMKPGLDGIPHWHKQFMFLNSKDCDIFKYIREKYGENLTKFADIRTQLDLDPNDLFLNNTMKKFIST